MSVNQVVQEGVIPNDWRSSTIINCYKGKGDALERGNYKGINISILSTSIVIIIQIGYFIFEIGIAIIQGYIFSLLITLYSDNHQ